MLRPHSSPGSLKPRGAVESAAGSGGSGDRVLEGGGKTPAGAGATSGERQGAKPEYRITRSDHLSVERSGVGDVGA